MSDKSYEDGLLEGRVRKLEDDHGELKEITRQNTRDIQLLIKAMILFFGGYAGIAGGPRILDLLTGG